MKFSTSKPRDVFKDASAAERLYFEMIDEACKDADPEQIISNGMPAHAVYILNTFLRNATEVVRICTGNLAREFEGVLAYANPTLIESARAFLGRPGSSLRILVLDDLDRNEDGRHPLLDGLSGADIQGNVAVWKTGPTDPHISHQLHYVVMDDRGLRIEHKPKTGGALVTFGDVKFAQRVANFFDARTERAQLVEYGQA